MPSTSSIHQARAYHRASDLPKDARFALWQHEAAANLVRRDDKEQLWIVLYDNTNHIEFVLSCTTGPLGYYPIFIVACKSSVQISQEEKRGKSLADALLPLVRCLLDEVPPQRVFSVFSIARVTVTFSELFETEAHARYACDIRIIKEPYYDATFTFCTAETLKRSMNPKSSPWSEDVAITIRRADMSHLKAIKAMCKAFSEMSPPFVLDDANAESEAKLMITSQHVWVYLVQKADQEPEIACLVSAVGKSDNVVAVTKVFTPEPWRGYGCATRLLYRVCEDTLRKKKRVVLYVGNSDELAPARKIYHKIGFQGLNLPQGQQVKDVERWLEIGFEGTDLGYW